MQFFIIAAEDILETGRISFKFMFDSGSDYSSYSHLGNWGALLIDPRSNEVMINVFNSSGLVMGWGNDKLNPEWIEKLIAELPQCTLLMNKETADMFKACCDKLNIKYGYHYYDGILKTS